MNGYQRAAWSLRELGETEQAWLLERLAPEERAKIVAALDALEADARRELESRELQRDAVETVKSWDAATLATVLAGEPVWVAALTLSQLDRALAGSVIEHMDVPHSLVIGQALQRTAGLLKPRAAEVLFRALKEKSERRNGHRKAADFDSTLKRVSASDRGG